MLADRLEEQLPVDTVEEGAYIEIEHPVAAPAALASLAHGIDRRFAGPVAVGVGVRPAAARAPPAPAGHPPGQRVRRHLESPMAAPHHPPSKYRPAAPAEE